MADPRRALPGNVPGPWFVDDSCSGCDASRQCASGLFVEAGGATVVARQPEAAEEVRAATRALLACPEGSIGARGLKPDLAVFPEEVEPGSGVYLAGFNSPRAYGGNAWLLRRPWGTALVDGPRFVSHLVKTLEGWGGLSDILLTHRDDLGDAEAYARHFGARVCRQRLQAEQRAHQVGLVLQHLPQVPVGVRRRGGDYRCSPAAARNARSCFCTVPP